jgi:hypothetical protein
MHERQQRSAMLVRLCDEGDVDNHTSYCIGQSFALPRLVEGFHICPAEAPCEFESHCIGIVVCEQLQFVHKHLAVMRCMRGANGKSLKGNNFCDESVLSLQQNAEIAASPVQQASAAGESLSKTH